MLFILKIIFKYGKSPLESMNQRDRQNAKQLIESKREIFKLEFALRTRREKIQRLRLRSQYADHKVNFTLLLFPKSIKMHECI